MTTDHMELRASLSKIVMRNVGLELVTKMKERGITAQPTGQMLIDYLDAHTPTMLLGVISDALDEVLDMRGTK